MNVDDLKWEYKPIENPDWNYARNLFTVLKRPQGTWSQSIFSVTYKNFVAPNRDYRYQGLTALIDKEYWKFLDCLFFGINDLELIPKKVIVFPWKCIYQYSSKNVNVDVEYYLAKVKGEGIAARVLFDIKSKGEHELTVKPLVDIRNVYAQSSPDEIGWRVEDSLIATRGKKAISFKIKNSSIKLKNEKLMWTYKLGSGYRTITNDGVKFIPEFGRPIFVGELRKSFSNNKKISLVINCVNEHKINFERNENEEKRYLEKLIKKFNCSKEVLARIIAFNKFGIQQDNLIIPEAGDFWFKQVWLRDLFEALLNNFETVMRIDEIHKVGFLNKYLKRHKSYIRKVLEWVLEKQDKKTGLFPNSPSDYNSTDATLLFFLLAEKYMEKTKDTEIAERVLKSLDLVIESFSRNKMLEDGSPVIKDNLLFSVPWHSWTDTRNLIMGKLVSNRIPSEWLNEKNLERFCKPLLLPEINALFIRALKAGESIAKLIGSERKIFYRKLYKLAVSEYKKVFKRGGFLYSLIGDGRKDSTDSSMVLVSAVLLYGHVFDKDDLKNMWSYANHLIVKRGGKSFGVLVRNLNDRIFLDDSQYHGAVVWPRDVPYLIKYLSIIEKKQIIKDILRNHLDHQMNEGAIFYCHELFSLPEGKNPSPTETKYDPVPMKNPIQLWSQFCDDYL